MAIFALDAAGTITVCHGACLATLGCSAEVAVGRSIFEIYRDDLDSLDYVNRALAGEAVTFVSRLRGIAIERRLVPQRDGAGTVTGLIGVATDVTAFTAAEEALRTQEVALWRSEARAQSLLESAPDAIIAVDQDGRIVLANSRVERLFGYPRQALLGYAVEMLLPEVVRGARALHQAGYQATSQSRTMGSDLELYARRRDGSVFPVEVSLSLVSEGGQHVVTAAIRDVSARKAMEEALRASEARFRSVVQAAPVGMCILDERGVVQDVNETYATLLGYWPQELVGKSLLMVYPASLRAMANAAYKPLLTRIDESMIERVLLRKDGSTCTTLGTRVALHGPNGRRWRGVFLVDIEERKRAESALQASEARFRALTEHSSDLTRVLDANGIIRYASTSHQTVLGYDPATLVGRSSFDFMHPDHVDQARTVLALVVAGGARRRLVKRVRHADGTYRSFESIFDNQLDNPAVRGVVVNARDITERLVAEAAQRASEAHFRSLVLGAPVGVCILDERGVFEEVNASYAALLGYQPEELVGQHFQMVIPEPLRAMAHSSFEQVLTRDAQTMSERILLRKDGSTCAALATSIPLQGRDGHSRRAAFVVDIDERNRAECAIEEARAFAEAMDRVSFALAATLEPDRLYQIILEQAMAVLPCDFASIGLYHDGWAWATASRGEQTVPPGTRLFPISGPDRPWLVTDQPRAVYLPDTDLEPKWLNLPPHVGERRVRSVIAVPLRIEGEAMGAFQIHSHTPQRYDARHLALADAFGARVVQALHNAQLYAEEQQRAREAEELAQLQRDFLGDVGHELLSPITATQGLAQLLQKQWSRFGEADRDRILEGIAAAAKRQHRLVEDLLDVSRAEAEGFHCERQPFALRPVLERAATEVQHRYPGQRIDLQGPDTAVAEGDAGRTQQILVNLLDNAAKYSPEGSPVTASWGEEDGHLVVRVRDHGLGIPAAGREQLFTRFGRLAGSATRAGRSGTGLGLYLSRLLARAMAGELDLESTGADGSTFRLLLPCAPQT
jgi:PAS domain S-box-containing protein